MSQMKEAGNLDPSSCWLVEIQIGWGSQRKTKPNCHGMDVCNVEDQLLLSFSMFVGAGDSNEAEILAILEALTGCASSFQE